MKEREVIITFQPPTADFIYVPESPAAGTPVTFDGTESFDFDGTIVSYAWDFNADGVVDSTDAITQHTFPSPGTFDVALTVVDDSDNQDTVIYSVTVSERANVPGTGSFQPPISDYSYTPAQPKAGDPVMFNGTTSSDFDGQITTYAWDFDADGVTDSTQGIVSHVFNAPGTYQVSLTVTDNGGNRDTVIYAVTVGGQVQQPVAPVAATQIPIADFQTSPSSPAAGDLILFNGTSSIDLDGRIERSPGISMGTASRTRPPRSRAHVLLGRCSRCHPDRDRRRRKPR